MTDSADKIADAKSMLAVAPRKPSAWAALGAATLAAVAAVLMAGVVVLGPGVSFDEPAFPTQTR